MRVKLDKPAARSGRVRLAKQPPAMSYDDLLMQHEIDQRLLYEANAKLTTATHEILTIQQGYRNLVQKAEANEAQRVRKQVTIEFTRELDSLKFRCTELENERDRALKQLGLQARAFYESGPNHSCPECGCVIRPIPLVNGRAVPPALAKRMKPRAE